MSNKILIADDSKSWLAFHIKLIEQLYGKIFDITAVSSAKEALAAAKAQKQSPYALIITDLQMESAYEPLSAGEWLIENIRLMKEYASSNIVIISSMPDIELTAKKYKTDCIKKSRLAANKLLMKYAMEKLMPFLDKLEELK